MVLDKLPVPDVLLIWISVRYGPNGPLCVVVLRPR